MLRLDDVQVRIHLFKEMIHLENLDFIVSLP